MTAPRRYFVRCADCLGVWAVESEREPLAAECGVCGGPVECMGAVARDGWAVRTVMECPCDERCTNAKGPKCDCSCGGKNHGSHRLVPVEYTNGKPRLTAAPDAKLLAVAQEWRDNAREVRAELDASPGGAAHRARFRDGRYVTPAEWAELRRYEAAVRLCHEARAGRTHKGRMNKLAAALAAVGLNRSEVA